MYGQIPESQISQEGYDKIKNCKMIRAKYLHQLNILLTLIAAMFSKNGTGTTVRQFTLIVEENQKIPITYEGHIFEGWTFNGTIPGTQH